MNCLCCGKSLKENEFNIGWHKACIKRFFGTDSIPEIEVNDSVLESLASENINNGITIPGVQKKLSLHLSAGQNPRLTILNLPTGFILKPQVKEYTALPEAEHVVMCMADVAGISTVPHALIKEHDTYAYITKRIDRIFDEKSSLKMLAMEDFCQLDLRLTQDKYKGSYERCAKIIDRYSSSKGFDKTELFIRVIFSYIVGNSDMHLKNFSLIETKEGSGNYVLSPAYDMLPVNIVMPEDKEQFALPLNGKKTNLCRKDFFVFAEGCGIPKISAEKMIKRIISFQPKFISMCNESFLPEKMKESFEILINKRIENLL